MSRTLIIQSHRTPLPASWIKRCLASVKGWARAGGLEYEFLGDALFDLVPAELLAKIGDQTVIATDLARLRLVRKKLTDGFDRVVWMDADTLIFSPDEFRLPEVPFAVGREVWIQQSGDSRKLRAYVKVHNAFLQFDCGNAFLDFYLDTAERLVTRNQGGMSPQFVGPKLLTALHNVAQFPVLESAGMLSPLVVRDIVAGGGPALELFHRRSRGPILAANLSASLWGDSNDDLELIDAGITRLLTYRI